MSRAAMNPTPSIRRFAAVGVLLCALVLVLYFFVDGVVTPVVVAESGSHGTSGRIADIVYHLELAAAHAAGEIDSPYDPASQWRIMANFYGGSEDLRVYAMPVGVTPVAFVVWRGLLAATDGSVPGAISLWVTASLTVFLTAVGLLYGRLRHRDRRDRIVFLVGVLLMTASLPAVLSVFLGQTSLLGAGGLLLLCGSLVLPSEGEVSFPIEVPLAMVGFLLLVWKPPYLALGVGMLLFAGRRRAALVGAVGTLLVVIVGTLVISPRLLTEYASQLIGFTGPQEFEYYRPWGVAAIGGSAATVRTLLLPVLGRATAYLVGAIALLAATMAVLALGGWRGIVDPVNSHPGDQVPAGRGVSRSTLVVALFALYLLLAPYVGRYEDLLILVPWAVSVGCTLPSARNGWLLAITVGGLATVAFVPVPEAGGAVVPFLGKVVALAGMVMITRESGVRAGAGAAV